jgi:ubiquitin-like protein Pup
MAEREQRRKPAADRTQDTEEALRQTPHSDRGDKLKAEIDDILDEIDEVLEENAEEFVRNYVQKGGE